MRARGLGTLVVGCIALAAALAPSAAVAKPGYVVRDPGAELSMSLRGSQGYRISIENTRHWVVLTASKGEASARYKVRGKVSATGIKANFGDLGQISVRFHGSPRPSKHLGLLSIKCKGKPSIREVGSFDGRIRFHGEMGFTALSARHAKGSVTRKFRRVCKRPPWLTPNGEPKFPDPSGKSSILATTLAAASSSSGRVTTFFFFNVELPGTPKEPGISLALARGQLREHRGGVRIDRFAVVEANAGSLLTSAPGVTPATATIALRSPFNGTGSYSKAPGSEPSWTGSLQVELPGVGKVPLTGSGFTAVLCEVAEIKALKRCLRPVRVEGPDSHGRAIARLQ
jgi:hypothetical protein